MQQILTRLIHTVDHTMVDGMMSFCKYRVIWGDGIRPDVIKDIMQLCKDLNVSPPTGQAEFKHIWKLYYILIITQKLQEFNYNDNHMKIVIQRVKSAQVEVNAKIVGQITKGMLVFLGVGKGDTREEADYLIQKISQLRIK